MTREMKKLRILHIISGWRWTGAADPMGRLAGEQTRQGHEVWVGCIKGSSLEKNIRKMGVDILDGTPLLDLKPYVDRFDVRHSAHQGWLEANLPGLNGKTDDGRFTPRTGHK